MKSQWPVEDCKSQLACAFRFSARIQLAANKLVSLECVRQMRKSQPAFFAAINWLTCQPTLYLLLHLMATPPALLLSLTDAAHPTDAAAACAPTLLMLMPLLLQQHRRHRRSPAASFFSSPLLEAGSLTVSQPVGRLGAASCGLLSMTSSKLGFMLAALRQASLKSGCAVGVVACVVVSWPLFLAS